jgi:hypothetical protein
VLIADTGYELYAACETVKDLDQWCVELGMADDICSASGHLSPFFAASTHDHKSLANIIAATLI